jgi:hypothetical protein
VACREGAGRRIGHQWHALRLGRQVQHIAIAVVSACGMLGRCWAEDRPSVACSTSGETGTVQHIAIAVVSACGMLGRCWAEDRPSVACFTSEETGTTYCRSRSRCLWQYGKVLGRGHQWHALRQRRQVQHIAIGVVGACGMRGRCWAEASPSMACSTSEETGTTYCPSRSGCLWHAGKARPSMACSTSQETGSTCCRSRSGCLWHVMKARPSMACSTSQETGTTCCRSCSGCLWHAGRCWDEDRPSMACSTSEETGTTYCRSRSGCLWHAGKVLG